MNQFDAMAWINIILNVVALTALGLGWLRNRAGIRAMDERLTKFEKQRLTDQATTAAHIAAIIDRLDRMSNLQTSTSRQLDNLAAVTSKLPSQQDVVNGLQQLQGNIALILAGSHPQPFQQTIQSGGARYGDGTTVRGPAIGGDLKEG